MSAGSEEKHGFGHVLPYLGKIQAVTRRCQQRLGRPYHFSTRSIPQNVIDALVREAFFAGSAPECQIVIPDFGTIEGAFQIGALEFSGNHDGEVHFEISLDSVGTLTFEAA